jgi:DNA-binding response OmpR family regulator
VDEVNGAMSESTLPLLQGEARVLVLLDQHLLAEVVRLTLNHGIFVTRAASDFAEGLRVLAEWQPQVAVMDMEIGGRQLLQQMGASPGSTPRIPVLGLTPRGDLKAKLDAFAEGVDDIMTMPFSPEELLARVLVITRRTYGQSVPLRPVLKVGDFELDILNRQVRAGDRGIILTGLELSLLYLLAANAGRLVTREQILDTLWGVDYVAESNVVDRHIRNLRAKLQHDARQSRYIITIPGQGYRFNPTFTEATLGS